MTIGVVGNPEYAGLDEVLEEVRQLAAERGAAVVVSEELDDLDGTSERPLEERWDEVDVVLTLGGDGTLLRGARMAGPRRIPLVGCNLGRLGFLTTGALEELEGIVDRTIRGDYELEERVALDVRVGRGEGSFYALNDAVVHKTGFARLMTMRLYLDGEEVGQYSGDGIVISTATGSTAYSLSAGGPIMHPSMDALLATPICPHTLAVRPLVVPGDSRLTVEVVSESEEETVVTVDGQVGSRMERGERVELKAAEEPFRLVRFAGDDFFNVLRQKLRWGDVRPRDA
ncbi:MAG: NAD(+)/NADH kinase [Candidatus Palauibacterales bacterium]|nr:NAD(+)/NADH kinase [Candidatus Palauibacterales bacterium]